MNRKSWGTLERMRRILVPRCYPQIKLPGCFPDRKTPGPDCYPLRGRAERGKRPTHSNRRLNLTRARFEEWL